MQAPILTDDEFKVALDSTDRMERPACYRLMLQLSIKRGLRPMEIAGLDSSWFRGRELRIPLGHSKRKSGRTLRVDEELLADLAEHMGDRTGRVFMNAAGEAFDARGISEAIRRVYRRAGVVGSCYSGRRTMATKMVDSGVNIAVVSRVLGHSSIATTQNYIGVTDAMMERAFLAAGV